MDGYNKPHPLMYAIPFLVANSTASSDVLNDNVTLDNGSAL